MIAMSFTAAELRRAFPAINNASLSRWRKRGWVHGESIAPGSGYYASYPDWTTRMVPIILNTVWPNGAARYLQEQSQRLRLIANCLAENPDTPWIVVVDLSHAVPAATGREAVQIAIDLDGPAQMHTLVAVPPPLALSD